MHAAIASIWLEFEFFLENSIRKRTLWAIFAAMQVIRSENRCMNRDF